MTDGSTEPVKLRVLEIATEIIRLQNDALEELAAVIAISDDEERMSKAHALYMHYNTEKLRFAKIDDEGIIRVDA